MQCEYFRQAAVYHLTSAPTLDSCKRRLISVAMACQSKADALVSACRQEIDIFLAVVDPKEDTFDEGYSDRLKEKLSDIKCDVLRPLYEYPRHGALLIQAAEKVLQGHAACKSFKSSVETFSKDFKARVQTAVPFSELCALVEEADKFAGNLDAARLALLQEQQPSVFAECQPHNNFQSLRVKHCLCLLVYLFARGLWHVTFCPIRKFFW